VRNRAKDRSGQLRRYSPPHFAVDRSTRSKPSRAAQQGADLSPELVPVRIGGSALRSAPPRGVKRAAYSAGVRSPRLPCGRSVLFSCRQCSMRSRASASEARSHRLSAGQRDAHELRSGAAAIKTDFVLRARPPRADSFMRWSGGGSRQAPMGGWLPRGSEVEGRNSEGRPRKPDSLSRGPPVHRSRADRSVNLRPDRGRRI
jgi:hypothetical protein